MWAGSRAGFWDVRTQNKVKTLKTQFFGAGSLFFLCCCAWSRRWENVVVMRLERLRSGEIEEREHTTQHTEN